MKNSSTNENTQPTLWRDPDFIIPAISGSITGLLTVAHLVIMNLYT